MRSPTPELRRGVAAAVVWILAWAVVFVGLGFNHALARQGDSGRLFLVGSVLGAFLVSLWLVSSRPQSRAALIVSLVMAGAVVVMAALLWRNAELLAVRWTPNREHDLAFVVSWVWVAFVWLSIVTAGVVAEVHHVLHSRAR